MINKIIFELLSRIISCCEVKQNDKIFMTYQGKSLEISEKSSFSQEFLHSGLSGITATNNGYAKRQKKGLSLHVADGLSDSDSQIVIDDC